MNTEIIIGIVVGLVAALIVVLLIGRLVARRRRISLRDNDDASITGTREVDRSGGYTADGGFSFSQGTAGSETPPTTPTDPAPIEVSPLDATGVDAAPLDTASTEAPTADSVPTDPEQTAASNGVREAPERTETDGQPGVGDDAAIPRDSAQRRLMDVALPDPDIHDPPSAPEPPLEVADEGTAAAIRLDEIAPFDGRLHRLRSRLARSQGAFGKGVLGILGGGDLDEDSWEDVEDTLLGADLGSAITTVVVERLRTELASSTVRSAAEVRELLRSVLIAALLPDLDRSVRALPHADSPAVLLMVGVNGTGKTTTVGKLARVLVADGRRVVLGAADTFRAAAADQLQTWGERVGATVIRGREGADPASVAFDAVAAGVADGVDVVVIDTAGRLHTKSGLMDELGKVKRVVEKKAPVDEVLLVLDATTGQNGMIQAKVFSEIVNVTGVVLTKLDGTAKGGIVFNVQHELGVPVKLVGLGEGADDLAPFEPQAFVDALLG